MMAVFKVIRRNLYAKVLTGVKVQIAVFWAVTSCSLVSGYKCFGRTYFIHLQDMIHPEDGDSIFLRKSW
jgi:hypothetical protein